jgi:hypothetical protein
MTINNHENQAILALSGKLSARTYSIYCMIAFPNVTI